MLDREYYINTKIECIAKMRIVSAGFVSRAKECMTAFEETAEDKRTEDDYVLLAKNLSDVLSVAEDMSKDLLGRIEYCDKQLEINAEEGEATEPAKASEDEAPAEGEDGTV